MASHRAVRVDRLTTSLVNSHLLQIVTTLALLTTATFISAVSVILFLVPSDIAPGGVAGIAIILSELFGSPIGIVTLILNVPIMVFGFYTLGGWRVMGGTVYFIVLFSLATDLLVPFFPSNGVSENHLLNAIFSGIFSGISGGIAFRVGVTAGGTTVLTRILNMRFGIPISNSTMYIDGLIVGVSGLVFGWESAMFAIVSLGVYGMVCDYVLEGPSLIRTATIITNHPQTVSAAILHTLQRGVTGWDAQGMYTQESRNVLFVTVLRSQVVSLRKLVVAVDPDAFIVIGQGHIAYGKGFKKVLTR